MGIFQSNNINIDNLTIKKQLKINVSNIILLNDERLAISSYNQGMVISRRNEVCSCRSHMFLAFL